MRFTLASGIMTIVLGAVMAAPMSTPAKLLWIVLLGVVGFVVTKPFYTLKTITPGLDPNVHYLAKAIGLAAGVKWLATDTPPADAASPEEAQPPMGAAAAASAAPAEPARWTALPAAHHPDQPALTVAPFRADDGTDDHAGSGASHGPSGPRSPSGGGGGDVIYPAGVIVQNGTYASDGQVKREDVYVKLPEPTLDDRGRVRDDLRYRPASVRTESGHG